MINKNSGLGMHQMSAFHNIKPTIGKVFLAGDSSTVDLDRLRALFDYEPDINGVLHYFATIDEVNNVCVADRGDVILVAPGHVETFTGTDLTLDTAGVTVIGLGSGSLQPQIKFNHADAEISVAADNVEIKNIRCSADVTGVKVGIEIEDGINDAIVRGNRFDTVTEGTDEFLVSVRTNDASNKALIENNYIDMVAGGGAVAGISMTKDTDSTIIRRNTIIGDYSTACIEGLTTKSTRLLIQRNLLVNGEGDDINTEPGIQLLTGSTGIIEFNRIVCNLATKAASIVADKCMLFENYYNEDVGGGATGGIIGTASADG